MDRVENTVCNSSPTVARELVTVGTSLFRGRYLVTGTRVTLSSVLSTDNGRSTTNLGYFSVTVLYCCLRTAPLASNTVTIAQTLPLPNLKIIDGLQENVSSLLDRLQNKVVPVLELRVPFGPQSKNSVAEFSDLPGSYSFHLMQYNFVC